MNYRLKNFVIGAIAFSIAGAVVYAGVNKIGPDDAKLHIKHGLNRVVEAQDKLDEKGMHTGFEKTRNSLKKRGIVDYDKEQPKDTNSTSNGSISSNDSKANDNDKEEAVYIDGELFEKVANRKAKELSKQADTLKKYVEVSGAAENDSISKKDKKSIVKISKELTDGIDDLLSMDFPKRDKSDKDAIALYGNEFNDLLKELVNTNGELSTDEYRELLRSLDSFNRLAKDFLKAYALS